MPNETTTEAPAAPAVAEAATTLPEAVTAPVETTPADGSTSTDPTDAIDGMSFEDLERTLELADDPTRTAPEPVAETPVTEPVVETPPVEAAGEGDEEEPLTKNFRFHTDDPKLSGYLRALKAAQKANPGVNPVEVARLVGYEIPGGQAQAPAPAAPTAPAVDPHQALRDEIAALDTEIETASTVDYDHAKALKLERQRGEKVRALERQEEAYEAQSIAQAEANAAFETSRTQAIALCPEATQENSIQFSLIAAEAAKGGTPMDMLKRAAAKFPAHFPKVVPGARPPAVVPAPLNKARPVGAVVAGNATAAPLNKADLARQIDNLSLDDLDALADAVGTVHRR